MSNGTSDPVSATVLNIGISTIERSVPTLVGTVTRWWYSKRVLVAGQMRAGKSTFIDYLHHGIFAEESATQKTYDPERTRLFDLAVGKDKSLEVTLHSVTDLPGQVGAAEHAKIAFTEKPHGILVFLDLTTSLTGQPDRAVGAWADEFCTRLEKLWTAWGGRNTTLKSLIFVLNKRDKVDQSAEDKYRKAVQAAVKGQLKNALGSITADIEILACTAVKTDEGTARIDAIITQMAKELSR